MLSFAKFADVALSKHFRVKLNFGLFIKGCCGLFCFLIVSLIGMYGFEEVSILFLTFHSIYIIDLIVLQISKSINSILKGLLIMNDDAPKYELYLVS
jgi:hypothetical protein